LVARRTVATALAAALALGAGAWLAAYWQGASRAVPAVQSGTLLGTPRPIAEFALTDHLGQPFDNDRLRGRWSLLFAGFTHCPDVCPTTLGVMKAVSQQLGAKAPAIVLLSVDPERDTPAVLKPYVEHFGPNVTGVTGARESLDRLCESLGVAYVKIPGATDADYTVDHTAALVLVDPQGRVAGYFTPPLKVDTLAADLTEIIRSAT
jgi:protein SCO1